MNDFCFVKLEYFLEGLDVWRHYLAGAVQPCGPRVPPKLAVHHQRDHCAPQPAARHRRVDRRVRGVLSPLGGRRRRRRSGRHQRTRASAPRAAQVQVVPLVLGQRVSGRAVARRRVPRGRGGQCGEHLLSGSDVAQVGPGRGRHRVPRPRPQSGLSVHESARDPQVREVPRGRRRRAAHQAEQVQSRLHETAESNMGL